MADLILGEGMILIPLAGIRGELVVCKVSAHFSQHVVLLRQAAPRQKAPRIINSSGRPDFDLIEMTKPVSVHIGTEFIAPDV